MGFANFLKQSTVVAAWRITGTFSGLLIALLVARLLEADVAAAYFLGFSIVMFVSLLGRVGLRQSAVRAVSDARDNIGFMRVIVFRILAISLAGSLVTSILVMYLLPYVATRWFESRMLAESSVDLAWWSWLMSMQSAITEILRGLRRLGWAAATDNVLQFMAIAVTLASISMANQETTLHQVFIYCNAAYGATLIASGLFLLVHMRKVSATTAGNKNGRIWRWRSLLHVSMPIMGINLSSFILRQGSLWVVGIMGQPSEVAAYAIALRIFALLDFPLLVFRFSLDPQLASLTPSTARKIEHIARRSATLATLSVILFLVLWLAIGPEALDKLFGGPYLLAFVPVLVLSIMRLASVLAGPAASVILMQGGQYHYLVATAAACMLSLVATALGHLMLGLAGASLGAGTGTMIQAWYAWLWSRRYKGIKTHAVWPALSGLRARRVSPQ